MPYNLPQECACLLEVDPADLYHWDMSQQQLQAMTAAQGTAAQAAHTRQEPQEEGQASGPDGPTTHTPYGGIALVVIRLYINVGEGFQEVDLELVAG